MRPFLVRHRWRLAGLAVFALVVGTWLLRPTVESRYVARARHEFAVRPAPAAGLLNASDLAHLPAPVRRYITLTGAVGQPRPVNMRVEFDAVMRQKPGSGDMPATSVQYNFFDRPTRLFFMRARMFGLPVQVFHAYGEGNAGMLVRVANLVNVADIRGARLFQAETVTFLNDACLMAPGMLADPRFRWRAMHARQAEVTFGNGGAEVKAVLSFNAAGELVNFDSDDRLAVGEGGVLRGYHFSTPISDYRDFNGIRLASHGDAVWHYPEGPFAYGSFTLRKVEYNVTSFSRP